MEVPQHKAKTASCPARADEQVRQIYRKLAQAWGPQHWWPAETPFEVIVGAILTQNTSWTNVERAMAKLREAGVLNLEGIRNVPQAELEILIRSSGYFRQKAQRLKDFVAFIDAKYGGSLEQMFATPSDELRAELLTQKGIGMETADSILLYAGLHSVFVVDAYTRRVFERHGIVNGSAKYDEIRLLVEHALAEEERTGRERGGGRGGTTLGTSAISDEHGATNQSDTCLQRDAWAIGATGQALLRQEPAEM